MHARNKGFLGRLSMLALHIDSNAIRSLRRTETRPDIRLSKLRADGQGQSLDQRHVCRNFRKSDRHLDRQMNRQSNKNVLNDLAIVAF